MLLSQLIVKYCISLDVRIGQASLGPLQLVQNSAARMLMHKLLGMNILHLFWVPFTGFLCITEVI